MTHLLDTARRYTAAGLSVVPVTATKLIPKRSDVDIAKRTGLATDAELEEWFGKQPFWTNVGIVTGPPSSGLVVIDIDRPHVLELWRTSVHKQDYWDVRLPALALGDYHQHPGILPIVQTKRGHHVYFRCELDVAQTVLAGRTNHPLIETRGAGGYVVAPGGVCGYKLIQGSLDAIPSLDSKRAAQLLEAGRLAPYYSRRFWTVGTITVEDGGEVKLVPEAEPGQPVSLDSEIRDFLNAIKPISDHHHEGSNLERPDYDAIIYSDGENWHVGEREHPDID